MNWTSANLVKIYEPFVAPESSIYEVSQVIIQEAKKLTGSKYGLAATIDPNLQLIDGTMVSGSPPNFEGISQFQFPINSEGKNIGLLRKSLETKKPLIDNSPHENPNFGYVPDGYPELENILIVPVLLAEKLVGIITLTNASDNYTKDDLMLLGLLFYAL